MNSFTRSDIKGLDVFKRSELKLLIEGLDVVRERMRTEDDFDVEWDEYQELFRLQDRLIAALEALPY